MKKMKILFVNYSIGGYAGDAVQMITIVKGLNDKDHEVVIATTDGDGYSYDETKSKMYAPIRKKLLEANGKIIKIDGMSVYPIHCLSSRFGMYCPSAAKEARKIIKKFDVVYVINWYYHLGMVFAKISHELKIPLIVGPMASLEDVARSTKKRQKLLADRMYTNDMLKNSNGFHCVGNQEKESLVKLGVNPNKIQVIDNAIMVDDKKNIKKTEIFKKIDLSQNKDPFLITIGRIDPKKGLELLLLTFSKLLKKYKNLILVIVGTGNKQYVKTIKHLVDELNIQDSVKFTGYVTEAEKIELLSSARLFVTTSQSDIHTTTAIEALAIGKPVVITKNSDFPEIDDYQAGITVESTHESIFNAISELLDNETKIQKFSDNAKRLVEEKFLLENQIDKYENMFREVINKK
tara:strand:- start:109 stop:1326 length:1218 start_codon:yes stop_codon:yes gene_type:complete